MSDEPVLDADQATVCSVTPARLAASAADTSPRSTDNTTCSFRSGVLFAGLDISISLHQTQPRPEQETLTRDTLERGLYHNRDLAERYQRHLTQLAS